MKKFNLLIILFSVLLNTTNAQINLSFGETLYSLKAPGFQTFFQTYNEENATGLQTPFKSDFPTAKGWSLRGGYIIRNHDNDAGVYYNTSIGVNHLNTKNEAIFKNNEKRKTDFQIRELATDVSLGVGGDNFHVAINGTFLARYNKLLCSYEFSDGSQSFGLDHFINGVYTASRLSAGFGAEVGFGIKYVQVVFKAAKVYKPFLKDGSIYLNYYEDLAMLKQSYNGASSYPAEYLPADYHQFVADQLTSESNNNFVYINDRGWQFGLSLMFLIPTNN